VDALPTTKGAFTALASGPAKQLDDISRTALVALVATARGVSSAKYRADVAMHPTRTNFQFGPSLTLQRTLKEFKSRLLGAVDVDLVRRGGVRQNGARAAHGTVVDLHATLRDHVAQVFSKGSYFDYRESEYPQALGRLFGAVVDCYVSMYDLDSDLETAVAEKDNYTLEQFADLLLSETAGDTQFMNALEGADYTANYAPGAANESQTKLAELRKKAAQRAREAALDRFFGDKEAQRIIKGWFDTFNLGDLITAANYQDVLKSIRGAKLQAEVDAQFATDAWEIAVEAAEEAREGLQEKQGEVDQLGRQVRQQENVMQLLDKQYEKANQNLDSARAVVVEKSRKLTEAEKKVADAQKTIDENESTLQDLRAKIAEGDTERNNFIEAFEVYKANMEQEIAASKEALATEQAKDEVTLASMRAEVAALEEELVVRTADYVRDLEGKEQALSTFTALSNEQGVQLAEARNEKAALEEKANNFFKSDKASTKQMRTLEEKMTSLNQTIKQLQSNLADGKQKLEQTEGQLAFEKRNSARTAFKSEFLAVADQVLTKRTAANALTTKNSRVGDAATAALDVVASQPNIDAFKSLVNGLKEEQLDKMLGSSQLKKAVEELSKSLADKSRPFHQVYNDFGTLVNEVNGVIGNTSDSQQGPESATNTPRETQKKTQATRQERRKKAGPSTSLLGGQGQPGESSESDSGAKT
jgi:hypothetical protein